jgi:type IV secretion system protein VirB6/type IV secretion system protein TrbL
MRNQIVVSAAVTAIVMFASGCGGNADAPASQAPAVDAGPPLVDDAGASDGDGGGEIDAAANPLGNLIGLLGGADAGGGLGAILGLLSGGNTTTGAGNLGDLLSLLGGGTTGTGTDNGLGALAALFGGGLDAGTGAFGGFTTCTSNEGCANGQTCQETPFQIGICTSGNAAASGRDAGTTSATIDAGTAHVDAGTPSGTVDSGVSSAPADAGSAASEDDAAASEDADLEGDAGSP